MTKPKTFTDALGREWCLRIDWNAFQRIKDLTGRSIDDLVPKRETKDPEALSALQELMWDGLQMLDVCWAILQPVCDEKGVSKEQFSAGWDERTFEAAPIAFLEGLRDFFPSPLRKAILSRILRMMEPLARRVEREEAKVNVEEQVNRLLDEHLKAGSTTTPESPALTPAP